MKPFWYDDTLRAEAKSRWLKATKDFFGFEPIHLTIQYSQWNLSTWDEQDMTEIIDNPKDTLKVLDSLWKEIANTDRNTTIRPHESILQLGIPQVAPLEYHDGLYNIITTSGLIEIAKRGTGEQVPAGNSTTHGAVGTGTTAEALADTALETEVGRKDFATQGVAAVSGTTERYGMPFTSTDVGAGAVITEAALLTKASGGECVSRVTAAGVTVSSGRVMTMQTDITHSNGTTV